MLILAWLVVVAVAAFFVYRPRPDLWPVATRRKAAVVLAAVVVIPAALLAWRGPDRKVAAPAADQSAATRFYGFPMDAARAEKAAGLKALRRTGPDRSGAVCYAPQGSPASIATQGVYAYFCIHDGLVGPLRLSIQRVADKPLDIERYVITAGNRTAEATGGFDMTERDGRVMEWRDRAVSADEAAIMHALAEARGGSVRFISYRGEAEQAVTPAEAQALAQMLDVYGELDRLAAR